MKKTTKLISLLLAVVLVIGIVPFTASAGTTQINSATFTHHFDEGDALDFQVGLGWPYTVDVRWEDENGQPYPSGWTVRSVDEYHLYLKLTPKEGKSFADTVNVLFNGVNIQSNAYNNYNENTYCWKEMNTKIELHVAFRYLSVNTYDNYGGSINTSMRYNEGFHIKNEAVSLSALAYDNTYHFDHWSVYGGTATIVETQNRTSQLVMGGDGYKNTVLSYYAKHNFSNENVIAPTANTLGYTVYSCDCGYEYTDNFTAQTGKVAGFKCAARTQAAEKFTWTAMKGVTGYQIQISNAAGSAWGKAYATAANAYLFKGLSAGSNYKFRIRTYIKASDGKNYFGPWAALASPTLPAATTIKASAAKKAFTATWAKKAVTGYQLQYSTKANFAGAKTVTIKNAKTVKYAVKNLKAKTTYYVRVRTYKTIAKVNYFSTWSTAKVKTK